MTNKLTLPAAVAALHRLALGHPDRAARLRPLLDRLAREHGISEQAKPPRRADIDAGQLGEVEAHMGDSTAADIAALLDLPVEAVQDAVADLLADRVTRRQ